MSGEEFSRWLKGVIAIHIARNGLIDFISTELILCHKNLLQTVRTKNSLQPKMTCNLCQTADVLPCFTNNYCRGKLCCYHKNKSPKPKPCPNKICKDLQVLIVQQHKFGGPSWRNTDARRWCFDSLEIAKCYMPPDGYADKTCLSDIDFNGLVAIIINSNHFNQKISDQISEKARNKANQVRHSATNRLSATELTEVFKVLKELLTMPSCLATDSKAQEAARRLDELTSMTLSIDLDVVDPYWSNLKKQVDKEQKLHNFRQCLVQFYKKNESGILLTPSVKEHEVPLTKLYVQPSLVAVDLSRIGKWNTSPAETKILNYRDMLFGDNVDAFKHIYVTAEAGSGKTSLSKHICQAWCESQQQGSLGQPDSEYLKEDIDALKTFEFVFLVSFRCVDKTICDLDRIIRDFVETNLRKEACKDISEVDEILETRPCLIILDGLDEWGHSENCEKGHRTPGIPRVKQWNRCTILTTTRPWKFDEGKLKPHEIDRHIIIKGLDATTSRILVSKVFELLTEETATEKLEDCIKQFNIATSKLSEDLLNIQYIQLQMACLWHKNRTIGNSMCQIYLNIIELTLSRDDITCPQYANISEVELKNLLPPFLDKRSHRLCRKHYRFLLRLGKLALFTLLESSTVFDKEDALEVLDESSLKFCLCTGLLTQNKNFTPTLCRCSDVSFQHKTIHEFLAALYIQSDLNYALQEIGRVCRNVESVLSLSYVFVFLSGLDSKGFNQVYNKIIHEALVQDRTLHAYRKRLLYTGFHGEMLFTRLCKFQKFQMDCVQEGRRNGRNLEIDAEDILITSKSRKYLFPLKTLISHSHSGIKSLLVRDCESIEDSAYVFEEVKALRVDSLEAVGSMSFSREYIEDLLFRSKSTLQCVNLRSMLYSDNQYKAAETEFPQRCLDLLREMQHLCALSLDCFSMTHDQIRDLIHHLSARQNLREIGLRRISCNQHKDSCEGFDFNLLGHQDLSGLYLHRVPLSGLKLEPQNLENCQIGHLSEFPVTAWLQELPHARKLEKLSCLDFPDNEATLADVIPKLSQLKCLVFYRTDLGERKIPLSETMNNIEWIVLERVKMASSALEELFEVVVRLQNCVNIKLRHCEVTPEDGYRNVKKKIEESKCVLVVHDGYNDNKHYVFCFQKVQENKTV